MSGEDVFEFFHSGLQSKSFAAFEEMRRNGKLLDVNIKVDNQIFPAHRLVLSAAIPYFQAMFDSNMSESKTKEITMKEIDPETLKALIDYAYTSKVKITQGNVRSLLSASEFLLITEVSQSCCQFLEKHFTPDNVISIETFAKSLNCSGLTESAHEYIRAHFDVVCVTSEFLSLPFKLVNDFIRSDNLWTTKEEKVFEAVIKWVKADDERTYLLPELLTGVRMTLLAPDYLVREVSKEELIRTSISCRDLVDEAKHCHMALQEPAKCDSFTTSERHCYTKKQEKLPETKMPGVLTPTAPQMLPNQRLQSYAQSFPPGHGPLYSYGNSIGVTSSISYLVSR